MHLPQIIIMVIGAVAAFLGWSNSKKGAAWGQPVTIIGAIIAICAALWSSLGTITGADQKESMNREIGYQKVQTRKLGAYLKEKYAGKKIVIMKDPTINTQDGKDTPQLQGLKEGLEGALEIVAEISPDLPKPTGPVQEGMPEDAMMEPIEVWFTPKELDKTLEKVSGDYDLLVTTFGLPQGVFAPKDFKGKLAGKKVVVAGGSIYELGFGFQAGLIVAAVTYKPNAEYDEKPVPKDLDTAFNKRYLLVTSENFKTVATENKDIFGTPGK